MMMMMMMMLASRLASAGHPSYPNMSTRIILLQVDGLKACRLLRIKLEPPATIFWHHNPTKIHQKLDRLKNLLSFDIIASGQAACLISCTSVKARPRCGKLRFLLGDTWWSKKSRSMVDTLFAITCMHNNFLSEYYYIL